MANWKKFVYLASPYSSSDYQELLYRYKEAWRAAVWGWHQGYLVYSPIAYTHPLDASSLNRKVIPYEAWLEFDIRILSISDEFWILKLPGYENSKGIQKERLVAEQRGIPIKYIDPEDIPSDIQFPEDVLAGKESGYE